jgi:hypothetical protein
MVDVLGLIRFESKIVHFSILFFFQKRRADIPLQKSKKKKKNLAQASKALSHPALELFNKPMTFLFAIYFFFTDYHN